MWVVDGPWWSRDVALSLRQSCPALLGGKCADSQSRRPRPPYIAEPYRGKVIARVPAGETYDQITAALTANGQASQWQNCLAMASEVGPTTVSCQSARRRTSRETEGAQGCLSGESNEHCPQRGA